MKAAARLLLVVALLLPFRGALAAAGALCHGISGSSLVVSTERTAGESHGDGVHLQHDALVHRYHDGTLQTAHAPPHDHVHAAGEGAQGSGTLAETTYPQSTCNLCSAVCSTPPLPAPGVSLHMHAVRGAERFPSSTAPCSTVDTGGPERPPRSI